MRISRIFQALGRQVYDSVTDKFYPMAGDSQGRVRTLASVEGWLGKFHGTPETFEEGDFWYDLDLHAYMGWD